MEYTGGCENYLTARELGAEGLGLHPRLAVLAPRCVESEREAAPPPQHRLLLRGGTRRPYRVVYALHVLYHVGNIDHCFVEVRDDLVLGSTMLRNRATAAEAAAAARLDARGRAATLPRPVFVYMTNP